VASTAQDLRAEADNALTALEAQSGALADRIAARILEGRAA
jgi:F0F1-type ATP synthase membrane subunit b/b'